MAQVNNVSIYKGEAASLVFTMSPVTNITGWTIVLTVRLNANDAASLFTANAVLTTPLAGVFTVSVTHAQTVALAAGNYAYDVQRTDAGSEAVLSIGKFTVLQEVLYP